MAMTTHNTCCAPKACACGQSAPTPFVQVSRLNTLAFSAGLCIGCGMCIVVCPHAVFAPGNGIVHISRPDACMECGACRLNCPVGALQVDSGVGCATAMINAALRGLPEPTCGGDADGCC